MSLIRRRTRPVQQAEGPLDECLPDLEFLALVKASLEALAPGVTEGVELKGNSMISPQGWAVAVAPPFHGGGRHYDLVALPDVNVQPDVPMFQDCVVAMSGNHRVAADNWVQTSGACLLEMLDRRERFAGHDGPDDERGVPGWYTISSGATAFGLDQAENHRMQVALLNANVLHRIADTFTADLESPFFNGVKVFYGGMPESMECEVRVNGERHDAASAAMAALDLPVPTAFTTVRYFALVLPLPNGRAEPVFPNVRLELGGPGADEEDGHQHDGACAGGCECGGCLDPEHPGFALGMPYLIEQLSDEERTRAVRVSTDVMVIAEGVGNFLKVRLPIQLEDGRTLVYLAWVYLEASVIDEVVQRVHADSLEGHRFEGLFCNAVRPWGEDVLRAPVVLRGRPAGRAGAIGHCEIVESSQPLMAEILRRRWPAAQVLGDRDPRLRVGGA